MSLNEECLNHKCPVISLNWVKIVSHIRKISHYFQYFTTICDLKSIKRHCFTTHDFFQSICVKIMIWLNEVWTDFLPDVKWECVLSCTWLIYVRLVAQSWFQNRLPAPLRSPVAILNKLVVRHNDSPTQDNAKTASQNEIQYATDTAYFALFFKQ